MANKGKDDWDQLASMWEQALQGGAVMPSTGIPMTGTIADEDRTHLMAALATCADILHQQYNYFVVEGFSEEQAFELIKTICTVMWGGGLK